LAECFCHSIAEGFACNPDQFFFSSSSNSNVPSSAFVILTAASTIAFKTSSISSDPVTFRVMVEKSSRRSTSSTRSAFDEPVCVLLNPSGIGFFDPLF